MSTTAVAPAPLKVLDGLMRFKDYVLPAMAISVIFVMLVPVPAAVLDLLLALSMAASMIVFLSAVQIRRAVELSVFPTLLLLLTLFRLSLNIASSRRILLHGQEGTAAAGKVIEAFGQFVVGGNYVVGFVLFLALIAIQFLVVSHGAVRTAEVTARFTLDALPGKQMAIDADMNAGLIDEAEARRRRQAIAREAEFYGAMDGAARFNQRDSLATILITAINIVAGLLIGTLQQGVGLAEAARTYTTLTVGDGLVTIIPSLLVSVAGGITLTRANSAGQLGGEIRQQLLGRPATLYISSLVCAAMCLIPGLPKFVFLLVAAGLFLVGRRVSAAAAVAPAAEGPVESKKAPAAEMAGLLKLEDLTLEIGFQLIPLVDEKQGGQLLNRIRTLRRNLSAELGFLIPPVHISDNLRLKPREYVFSMRGLEIGRWQTEGAQMLAVSGEPGRRPLAGRETREPAFGVPAIWIQPALEEQAVAAGYSVVDATTVITTHLGELIRQHAWELLGRAEIKRSMDALNDSHPKLIEELVPKLLTPGRSGPGAGAVAPGAGVDPRPGSDSGSAARDRAGEQEPGGPGGSSAAGDGAAPGAAAARRRGTTAGAVARCRDRGRDPGHGFARRGAAAARRSFDLGRAAGASAGRFCEISYRLRIADGSARAPVSKSGALSRAAVAGASVPAAGGGIGGRDSAAGAAAACGYGALNRAGEHVPRIELTRAGWNRGCQCWNLPLG